MQLQDLKKVYHISQEFIHELVGVLHMNLNIYKSACFQKVYMLFRESQDRNIVNIHVTRVCRA
jgi:hypothetical protein